jgi:hypothetical protein
MKGLQRFALIIMAVAFTAVGFSQQAPEGVAMAMATPLVDVESIAKWAGKYDRTMIMQMLNGLDIFNDLRIDRNVSRHGKLLPKFTAESGLRPLDTNVEENGRKERTLGGRKLFVHDCMKLFKVIPEELRESFLADMLEPGAKREPFASWFWQREMEKLASEINDNFYLSAFNADAAAWASGSTYAIGDFMKFIDDNYYKAVAITAAGESPTTDPAKWQQVNDTVCFNGIGTIIANEITASNLPVTTTGAITEAASGGAFDQLREMYTSMATAHKNKRGVVHLSHSVYEKYIASELAKFGSSVANADTGDGRKYIYGTNKRWEIKPASWMTGERIIMNIENNNLVLGTTISGSAGPRIGKVVETVHGYKTSAKFLLGAEIADLECLYVNDQA